MKKIISFLLFICCASFSIAQIPGYKGYRLSVGYSANVSPALLSPLANTRVGENSDPNKELVFNVVGLNATHGVNIDYVIRHSTVFCVSAQVMKTGLAYKNGYKVEIDPYGLNDVSYKPSDDLPMELKVINFTAGFKFFRGYLAPYGKYVKVDLQYFREKVTFNERAFSLTRLNNDKYIPPAGPYNFQTVGVALSMGKQRIFFDRLVVDMGLRIGIIPGAFFKLIEADEITEIFSSKLEKEHDQLDYQIKQQSILRLQGSQLINFHIGVGFLAF